jgi:hypothetical protein
MNPSLLLRIFAYAPLFYISYWHIPSMTRRAIFVFFISIVTLSAFAQEEAQQKVTPGPEFGAGFFHRFLFGSSWRTLWTTPIEVETLDLGRYAGGIRPLAPVNGQSTKALHFKGNDGNEYVFSALNMGREAVVDPKIQSSFVGGIADDFVGTTNPFALLVTAPILTEVDLDNAGYSIVALPVDEKLGEYKEEFGGAIGLLQEVPKREAVARGYLDETKTLSTTTVLEKLQEDNENAIDAMRYLKVRMMDIYLGEWDRGLDKWRWSAQKSGAKTVFTPIELERDQTFSRYTGIVPFFIAQNVAQIESCDDNYPWIADLTWSGRHLDRRFLSSLEKPVWDSLKTFILSKLTDELIEGAVKQLPPEMFEKEGEKMIKMMRSRRDKFASAIDEYYTNMVRYVDVYGSEKNEFAEISRVNDDSVSIMLYKRDKDNGGKKGTPFFTRTFDRNDTREIRLYLEDGDDFAKVEGNVNGSILTRIIGGGGKDELVDSSNVRGYLWSILPFKTSKTRTVFYESGDKTEFVYGPSTCIADEKYVRPKEDSLLWEPLYRDWGHAWNAFPSLYYTTDEGVYAGATAQLTNYSFRSIPYQNQMDFSFGYAVGAKRYRGIYDARFADVWKGTLGLVASASSLDILNFYGYGNETQYLKPKADADYYKIDHQEYAFAPNYEYRFMEDVTIRGGAALRYNMTPFDGLADSSLIKEQTPRGTSNMLTTTLSASGTLDTRNSSIFPERGFYLNISSFWTPEILDNKYAYTKAIGDLRIYFTAPILSGLTLGLRARGERVWGEFPFYDAAFLGGADDLRGFARERFAGDGSVLGSAELRVNLGKFFIIVPGNYGFTVSAETGKVLYKETVSDIMHTSINWGVWIAPISKDNIFSLTVASSEERTTIILKSGFVF